MSSGFRDLVKTTQSSQKRADLNINKGAAISGQAIVSSSSCPCETPQERHPFTHLTSRAWMVAAQPSRICNFPLTTAFSSPVLVICLAQGERSSQSRLCIPTPVYWELPELLTGACWFWLHQQLDELLPSPEQILLEIKLYLSSIRESTCSVAPLNLQHNCNFQQEKQGRAGIKTLSWVPSLAFISERAFGEGLGWVPFRKVEKRQIFPW